MLRTRKVQRIRRLQAKVGAQLGCHEINSLSHLKIVQTIENLMKAPFQNLIFALVRSNQAFELHKWRYREFVSDRAGDCIPAWPTPFPIILARVDEHATVDIDQSHASRSARMPASISSWVRLELSGSGFCSSH